MAYDGSPIGQVISMNLFNSRPAELRIFPRFQDQSLKASGKTRSHFDLRERELLTLGTRNERAVWASNCPNKTPN